MAGPFVARLVNQLFAGNYSYSWWIAGTLMMKPDYLAVLATELANFSLVMQDRMEHLKLALLQEAKVELNALSDDILACAAVNQIQLLEEPQSAAPYSSGSYGLWFRNWNRLEGLTREEDAQYSAQSSQFS